MLYFKLICKPYVTSVKQSVHHTNVKNDIAYMMFRFVTLILLVISSPQWLYSQHPYSSYFKNDLPKPANPFQEINNRIRDIGRMNTPNSFAPYVYDPFRSERERIKRQNEVIINGYHQSQARRQALIHEAYRDMVMSEEEIVHRMDHQNYLKAWNEVAGMINSKSYSLKDAIYKIESAILPKYMSYKEYSDYIANATQIIYQAMEQEGYNRKNESAKKMMLHKYMHGIIEIYDENNSPITRTQRMQYDFDDPMGKENIENQFVLKLIKTNKGQCHSLPLFYLIMAEELGFKAWLSTAPNHFFVKVKDDKGKMYNLELTNGHYTNDQFMMQSGYITTESVINKTFLDTLSTEEVLHYCLSDLQNYYINKHGYQPYLQRDIENLVSSNPKNMTAWLILSNFATFHFYLELKRVGNPKPEELEKHERLHSLYKWMQSIYKNIDEMGFNPMPLGKYKKWLKSFNESNEKPIIKA